MNLDSFLISLAEASFWNHRRMKYVSHSCQLSSSVFSQLWAIILFCPQRVYIIYDTRQENRPDARRSTDSEVRIKYTE